MAEIGLAGLDERALAEHVTEQRWYASRTRDVANVRILDEVPLRTAESPLLSMALAEVRFQPGTHETYQLLLGARPTEEGWQDGVVGDVGGLTVYDALADSELTHALVDLMRGDTVIESTEGTIELRPAGTAPGRDVHDLEPRAVSSEQSNSSVIFGDELILKLYRRLEAGINPELELLRFLTSRSFPNIAALTGWFGYTGRPLDATLGVLQRFVEGGKDGWDFAQDALADDGEPFLDNVQRLGVVTAAMHNTLASETSDPSFTPEVPSMESLGLLVASVDEEIEHVFRDLPEEDELAPIAGRGEEVREQLRVLSHAGSVGRIIRHHGDYHLGQVLWTGEDWVVIDFEGEPARSLSERRQKRSPLRDVAGMLRSFAYAAQAAPMLRGVDPAPDFEQRARDEFLAGYLDEVEPSLLPPGEAAIARLLSVFELEKAVYELRYELDNRPEWLTIPVRGIERLLHAGVA